MYYNDQKWVSVIQNFLLENVIGMLVAKELIMVTLEEYGLKKSLWVVVGSLTKITSFWK